MPAFFHPLTRSADWIRRHQFASKNTACSSPSCTGSPTLWQRLHSLETGTFLDGKFYCRPRCLEIALAAEIARLRAMPQPVQPPNRIPLGLLMVARGKLTHLEVRAALEAQHRARYGKIGDWLEKLGFATEKDVTAALALQWGCPLLSSLNPAAVDWPGSIPLPILEAFQMLPVNYVEATRTLYLAFGERVDHAVLYAIEKTLGCSTQPCVAPSRSIRRQLESFRQAPRPRDVEFVTRDLSEISRITSSYLNRLSPEEARLSRVRRFIWLRLRARSTAMNLLFNLESSRPSSLASSSSPLAAPGFSHWRGQDEAAISIGD